MSKEMNAEAAVELISDNNLVWIGGSGGGHAVPETLLTALERRFINSGYPRDLTVVHAVGIGDWVSQGVNRLAHEGLVKRSICGTLSNSPKIAELAQAGKIESYTLPQGVLSELVRDMAGGRPGLITHVGLETFVDPRIEGGKQGTKFGEDLVEVITIGNQEWLFYQSLNIDVALIRATTADEKGNLTMENEAFFGENLSIAQAAHRNGGIVIAQVERLTENGSLRGKDVKVPGILVDHVVVDSDPWQTYSTKFNPAYAGVIRTPRNAMKALPLDHRKVIARRAAQELFPGATVNLGYGVANGISIVAAEEGIDEHVTLTVEQGLIGGVPALGNDAGAAVNYDAMLDQPYQFDFYDGGGLDIAFLSFAQVDSTGNVNVSKFGGRIIGPGGFINISQNAKRVSFLGTLTTSGLHLDIQQNSIQIVNEGSIKKFVERVEQITWSSNIGRKRNQTVQFITERAVFELSHDGLVLTEVAPGIDIERDVLRMIEFPMRVDENFKIMDKCIFNPHPMRLADGMRGSSQ